jgi:serine/threonine-protein kinase
MSRTEEGADKGSGAADRWERVQHLIEEALELDVLARAAFLDSECEDPELRAEVESLIEASGASEEYFGDLADRAGITLSPDTEGGSDSSPSVDPQWSSAAEAGRAMIGSRIGQYTVLDWLGAGGMASVYLAEREGDGFVQRVALKVVSTKVSDPLIQRRSNEERRILARLEHHGIARLIDGGVTPEGYPFYAMEFVEGKNILRHCDDLRLTIEDRLRLFLDLLVPVQYAHERLVIHCDLKPSNIWVTAEGSVKLLDFGVARLIDPNSAGSGTTGLWFTPAYASPEQVRREPPGTASDVYSLGVLLYELLSGHRPYRFGSNLRDEIAKTVGEFVPAPPSEAVMDSTTRSIEGQRVEVTPKVVGLARRATTDALRKSLRGDLDAIVMKALAKDPEERYSTAERLAADLRRHLEHELVSSVTPTSRYRATKFVRRNRTSVTAAVIVGFALTAGLAGSLWQARRATLAAALAADEAEKAQLVAELMGDLFRLSDPSESLGDTITARDLLDRGAERIRSEFGDQPDVQADLLSEVARVYNNMGLYKQAQPLAEQALELRAGVFGPVSLEASESLVQLGVLYSNLSDQGRAIELLSRAIDIRTPLVDGPDPELIEAKRTLGWQVRQAGEYGRAAALFESALQEQRQIDESPAAVADLMFGLASSLHDDGLLDEADAVFNEILSRVDPDARPTPNSVSALHTVGMVRRLREQYVEADPILASAYSMSVRLYGSEHPEALAARNEYAMNLGALGRWQEAEGHLRAALVAAERSLGPDHQTTARLSEGLGSVLEYMGRYEESVAYQQVALEEKVRRHENRDHAGVLSSLVAVGRTLALAGRVREADDYLTQAEAMGQRLGSTRSVYRLSSERSRGLLAQAGGDYEVAEEHFLFAIQLADEILSRPSHRFATGAKFEYAIMLMDAGRRSEAAALLEEVESLLLIRVDASHPLVSEARSLLQEARSG